MYVATVLLLRCRDAQLVRELGLTLKYVLNTHVHADHITGTSVCLHCLLHSLLLCLPNAISVSLPLLSAAVCCCDGCTVGSGELKALHPGCQSVLAAASTGRADVLLQPYERVCFGDWSLRAVPTPGHTAVRTILYSTLLPITVAATDPCACLSPSIYAAGLHVVRAERPDASIHWRRAADPRLRSHRLPGRNTLLFDSLTVCLSDQFFAATVIGWLCLSAVRVRPQPAIQRPARLLLSIPGTRLQG